MENEEIDDGMPSIEELRRARTENAARARAIAAVEPWIGGAGVRNPVASGATSIAESPLAKVTSKLNEAAESVTSWVTRLPRNLSLGTLDALVNTAAAPFDFVDTMSEIEPGNDPHNLLGAPEMTDQQKRLRAQILSEREAMARGERPVAQAVHQIPKDFAEKYSAWRQSLRGADGLSDATTQGIAQFVVPFTAWSKWFGVSSKLSFAQNAMRAAGAEIATGATAYPADEGRAADLYALGQQAEGKLADVLNTMAPDGSLLNSYIDYMTDRDDESLVEGRFKNALDSVVTSGAVFGVLKSAATALKIARRIPEAVAENSVRPGSLKSQEGKIVFHGTPHDVDEFRLDKIGTGEGQQAHGYGLYFAEAKDVANTYRGSNSIVHRLASASMYKHKNDWRKAVADLKARGDNRSAAAARALEQGQGTIPGGNLYSVEIPDEAIGKMIDADKPLAEQPEVLRKLAAAGYEPKSPTETGGEFVRRYGREGFDAMLAEDLRKADIPGIRFLDGRSRKGGEGTRNIVLFDDKLATIKSKE